MFLIAMVPVFRILAHGLTAVDNNGPITVSSDGLTIYASTASLGHDCTLADQSQHETSLDAFGGDFTFTSGGLERHALASTPAELDPGKYTLHCSGVAQQATLWAGDRITFSGFVTRVVVGVGVLAVLGLAGLITLIVLLVKRHHSKSAIKTWQRTSMPGYGAGWQRPPPPPR